MCLERAAAHCQNKQGFRVKGGELTWHACESEKFCVWRLGKYFLPLKCRPNEPNQIDFALLINGRFCKRHWHSCCHCRPCECVSLCTIRMCAPVNVYVIKLCRQRLSRNLSSAMLMLAWRQTWGLTEEPITIILEKWSKVSFYSPPNQGEVVYHFGKMFGCLPCMSALGP